MKTGELKFLNLQNNVHTESEILFFFFPAIVNLENYEYVLFQIKFQISTKKISTLGF